MAAKKDEKVEPKPVVAVEGATADKPGDDAVELPLVEEKVAEADPSAEAEPAADENPTKAEDANTVLVQAIRSFEGIEGDKGPRSEPFRVSRQRYADLKANDLVELVDEKAGSDPH